MASVLYQFDFDATTDDPQLLPREDPVVPAYDEAISSLEDACARGELSIVKTKIELWRRSWAGDLAVSYLGRALRLPQATAIQALSRTSSSKGFL